MDERSLAKLKKMSDERLVSVLYALVKTWEISFPNHFDEKARLDALISELNSRDSATWSRFLFYSSKVEELKQIISLSVFLERYQNIQLKDEDMLSTEIVDKGDTADLKADKIPMYLVLDNLRSSFNVGSVFRMADCLGVSKIFLLGYTASPENEKIKKSAMGADSYVEWEFIDSVDVMHKRLVSMDAEIVALETAKSAINHFDFKPSKKSVALWVGNERFGIDEAYLDKMDQVIKIPLYGKKNSLNVAQALSIVSFPIGEQLRKNNG